MATHVGVGSSPEEMRATITRWYELDEQLYALAGAELAFMRAQTGIEDEEALKRHILAVQKEAYAVFPFPCIRHFNFIKFKISRLPGYDRLLALGKERKDAIFLDIGCCFGNDVRKAVEDGFPLKQVVASDLYPEYWDLAHKLYRSTPDTFPAAFVPGDAFDAAHLTVVPPVYADNPEADAEPTPNLSSLTSLNPLHGRVAAIHASSFFHLFDEAQQAHLAHALGGLLSPAPGSMVFGTHAARAEKGTHAAEIGPDGSTFTMFCHSPESWAALWDGDVFRKGAVSVDAALVVHKIGTIEATFLEWCVTRV
ncbi:hypothetical protein BD413DRAFT_613545 [Trametes elegans]|nr:hypothetical protein BD413DRAFT_613545 [Trametes elegans]